MFLLLVLSPQAIGPVWPAMLVCFAYMAAATVFLLLARLRTWFRALSLREYRFLQRLYDATEMFTTLAILSGMIGTCLGLLEVLPALGQTLRAQAGEEVLKQVLGPLRNVWVSTIVGLILGGLWGEVLLFVLKPYTRPTLLPLSTEEPPDDAFDLPETGDTRASEEQDLSNDWREKNHEGIY